MTHDDFMDIAHVCARSSKCVSLKVGAVLVRDGRIISTGRNGTPPGFTNCCDIHTERGPEHSAWSERYEIHAEMNCVLFAARHGIETEGAVMYVTIQPCHQCLKNLTAAGVTKIYYDEVYYREADMTNEKIAFADELGIDLIDIRSVNND